jgi:hypothetical protein
LPEVVFVRVNWDHTAGPFHMPGTRWFDLHVGPEPGYPFGRRGLALEGAWRQLGNRECAGMVVMDSDVMIDPLDWASMLEAVGAAPRLVHVAPVRLWPASTQRESWVWGHWDRGGGPSQELVTEPTRWSFGFTYLPRELLTRARQAGMKDWTFPNVDMRMAACARRWNIKAKMVENCHPKHLHYLY